MSDFVVILWVFLVIIFAAVGIVIIATLEEIKFVLNQLNDKVGDDD